NRPVSNRRQSQFGLIYGGPIVLPKKVFGPVGYDGHDKSFFFVAIEPRYYYDGNQGALLIPTPEMLRGDFSNVVAGNRAGTRLARPPNASVWGYRYATPRSTTNGSWKGTSSAGPRCRREGPSRPSPTTSFRRTCSTKPACRC